MNTNYLFISFYVSVSLQIISHYIPDLMTIELTLGKDGSGPAVSDTLYTFTVIPRKAVAPNKGDAVLKDTEGNFHTSVCSSVLPSEALPSPAPL